jgi:hypothetical protein
MMVVAWGVYFAADALDAVQNGSPRYALSIGLSLFLIAIGLLGILNALRFKKRK